MLLKARKVPVQARSAAAIDALHDATVQVLTREGLRRCTTTRIAERAGVSVGSLYQYYPNRDALLAAVAERHLQNVVAAIEQTCSDQRGKTVAEMASAFVSTFLAVKFRNPAESKALFAAAEERGGAELISDARERITASVETMLQSASDALFDDAFTKATVATAALAGPIQLVLNGHASPGLEAGLEKELTLLLKAYLQPPDQIAFGEIGAAP